MRENFRSMPGLLKFLTFQAFMCFVFLMASVIPNDSFSINGRDVSYAEWWACGAGLIASAIGLIGPIIAWAFVTKRPHARPGYLVFLAIAFIAPYPLMHTPATVFVGLGMVIVGACYLYRCPSARRYFEPSSERLPINRST